MSLSDNRPQARTVPEPDRAAPVGQPPAARAEPAGQNYRETFGTRIRLLRTARRLSQQQLAERAGLTRNYVSAIERGTQTVDLIRLHQLADAFGLPLPTLIADDLDIISLV